MVYGTQFKFCHLLGPNLTIVHKAKKDQKRVMKDLNLCSKT